MKGKPAIIHCPAVTFSQRKALQILERLSDPVKIHITQFFCHFEISYFFFIGGCSSLSFSSIFLFLLYFFSDQLFCHLKVKMVTDRQQNQQSYPGHWALDTWTLDSGQWMVDSYKNVFIDVFQQVEKHLLCDLRSGHSANLTAFCCSR